MSAARVAVAAAVAAGVAALVFVESFHAKFTWDDRAAVLWNADVDSRTPIRNLLLHDYWGQNIGEAYVTPSLSSLLIGGRACSGRCRAKCADRATRASDRSRCCLSG